VPKILEENNRDSTRVNEGVELRRQSPLGPFVTGPDPKKAARRLAVNAQLILKKTDFQCWPFNMAGCQHPEKKPEVAKSEQS